MRTFTVEDIINWEREMQESFFDSVQVMNVAFMLGFLLLEDKELYNIVKPLLTKEYGEFLTVEEEYGQDENDPAKMKIFRRFQEAFIKACNMSETHNARMVKIMDTLDGNDGGE